LTKSGEEGVAMRTNVSLSALVFFLLFCCLTPVTAAQFHKWTDKEGTVHYSDRPPDASDIQREHESSSESASKLPPMKTGWNRTKLNQAIRGCTKGMVDPNLASYRQRAQDEGHQITPEELAKVKSMLVTVCRKTCTCVIARVSRKWSFEEFQAIDRNPQLSSEYGQYIQSLLSEKICPVPGLSE
jgi:hypothetical protein